MKRAPLILGLALACSMVSSARADIVIDVIGPFEVSLEGTVQADGNWFDNDVADLNGDGNNGDDSEFELRRAELILKGKGTRFDWVVGYDAKADKFLDANVKWKLGRDHLLLGQYKQPNSLEELSSTKNNDFISKALTTNLFAVSRRLGVGYGIDRAQWGASASVFGRELTRDLAHGSGFGARGYWTPLRADGRVVHLGLSLIDRDTDADTLRLRARPDADLATVRLIDSGSLRDADRVQTVGLEALWIQGPLKLQGEYMRSSVDRYDHADYDADSAYLQAVWNVTGEPFGYKGGVPTTPLPGEPATGMWQLGLRYDSADLNDAGVRGGEQDNLTIGANWYWRSNFKVALNYVRATSRRFDSALGHTIDDDPSIVEARLQFYW